MNSPSAERRTRLFTAFGTVLYVELISGELRHGPVENSSENVIFVADPNSLGHLCKGRLMYQSGDSRKPINCASECCAAVSDATDGPGGSNLLELIPLERGLVALAANGRFLSAIPGGRVLLSAPRCSTWELFLPTEDWCTDESIATPHPDPIVDAAIDVKRVRDYIIHPLIRTRANVCPKRAKVLIYGYTKWSHGRVYYDLSKLLHRRGYIVDILDWQTLHDDYIDELISYYDLFMTALDGAATFADRYRVPYDRTIALSHHEFDIRMLIEQKGTEVFDRFANYGVVSESLYCASFIRGVQRAPTVAPPGVNFREFRSPPSERLDTVGYAGSMSVNTYGVEWKRGALAEACAREAGLAFKIAGWTGDQISFHDMPDFYRTVDAIVMSSISEGAGLPVMEAAAAGRLVIGTPVGHFAQKALQGGGIVAPIEAEKFKGFVTDTLRSYHDNPSAYVDKCHAIQEAAKLFDWQYTIDDWMSLIDGAGAGRNAPAEPTRRQGGKSTIADEAPARTLEKALTETSQKRGDGFSLDKIHVINLDASVGRYKTFLERNSHLKGINRVSAVDGRTVDRDQLVKEGLIEADLSYLPGSLGCAMSHVQMWKRAVAQDEYITVMEDDVICAPGFQELAEDFVQRLPSAWDIIQWGFLYHPLFMWLDFGFSKAKLEFYERRWSGGNLTEFKTAKFSPVPVKIAHSFGNQGYSVSPRGARTLLAHCLPLRNRFIPFPGTNVVIKDTGIDCPMCAIYSSMEAFACVPPLVIHDDGQPSDRVEADRRS